MTTNAKLGRASKPELKIYGELKRRGLRHGIDFIYQRSQFGGRTTRGGFETDFMIFNPVPNLALEIQGEYFHYTKRGTIGYVADRLKRVALAGLGIRVVFIDERDALNRPRWAVGQAFIGQDHSRLGR